MKKLFLCIIPMIMLVIGCAGSVKPVENAAANSGLLTLDQALNEAASRIDERIPAGSKIAPLNFNSPHDKFSDYVLEELTANLVETRKLTVVDRREINLIRNEMDFQFSGEVADDSMQEIGRMLGAQSIISGNFTDMGGFIRIMIRVLNVQNASVEVQYRANILSDTITTALLTGGRTNVATTTPRQNTSGSSSSTAQVTQAPSTSLPVQQQTVQSPQTPTPPIRYTVTYNANGASGKTPTAQTVQNSDNIIIPDIGEMTYTGRNFGGWNTNANGTGTQYSAGDSLVVTSNSQLFAQWIIEVYVIGDTGPAGGKIFYFSETGFSVKGVTCHYLEAAPADIVGTLIWSNLPTEVFGTRTGIGSGAENTAIILALDSNAAAARACTMYRNGGKSDWFLPSKEELNEMYWNKGSIGGFSGEWYWSSTEGSAHRAWGQKFDNGKQEEYFQWGYGRNSSALVRPIRAF